MPRAARDKSKGNAPTASEERSAAARRPPGYERCWCRGFNVGCGLIRSTRTRRNHANKERRIRERNEARLQLPVDEAREDQPHDATMGSHGHDTSCFCFYSDQPFSSEPEPGPSRLRQSVDRATLMAALDSSEPRTSTGVKRKRGDDNDLRLMIQSVLADSDDNDNDDNDSDDSDDGDNYNADTIDKPSWVDCWVDQPPGERGRANRNGRLGWGKPEIMEVTGITEAQYSRYMVSLSIVLAVRLGDSIFTQKSAHRLCDHYFDVTKGFRENERSNPVGYEIIVEEVRPSHLHFFGIISIC